MKVLKEFINEKFEINKNTKPNRKNIDVLIQELIDNPNPEPLGDEDKYIEIFGHDDHYIYKSGPHYIKVDDLYGYTDKDSIFKIVYQICKEDNPKITSVSIRYWYPGNKNCPSGYAEFAKVNKTHNMDSWHPDWVHSNKYPFK